MADNDVQQNQEEGQQTEQEQQTTGEGDKLLTQEEFNQALSARINEINEQSAAQMQQLRLQTEATINHYRQLAAQQQVTQQTNDDDDPAPANMTPDQRLMWDANKPTRQMVKRQMREMANLISQSVNPIVADSTVRGFYDGRPKVPQEVKDRAVAYYKDAANDPNVRGVKPEQLIAAAHVRAMAEYAEQTLMGNGFLAPQKQTAKPQPKVNAPNGSADLGGGTRPLGVGRVGKTQQTWQEIQAELIASGKFPEDPL